MATSQTEITITPDPQILQVLSYLEMKPQDSICELIDNSLDAIHATGEDSGSIIAVDLPTRKEVEEGTAVIRVRDNGPGMTLAQVQDALRAGYSSKQRYGSLGLFGVGFNIATGKLGRTTTLITARADDDFAVKVELDLINLRKSGNFKVLATTIPKPQGLLHGTLAEVSRPWGANNQNAGFMLKLVSIGRPKLLDHLGRIYATTLRSNKIKLLIADSQVTPFEHCVWDDSRYVEHAKWGKIYAVNRFHERVIYSCRRCAECSNIIAEGEDRCPDSNCRSGSTVTQQERISGWVGIQRYGDSSHYGIDLIRNGRAIRLLEKAAFFDFEDPLNGDPIHDYPIDQNEGRIVGELHLDHVPVDPAKQNFERSSPEWRRAIEYVRGSSSLQPERPGADANRSPIFMLYQGYRKVRGPGRRSMAMGKWEPGRSEARLLSRDDIDALKKRFDAREVGYYDDLEWWNLVELADQKPVAGLIKCSACHLESPEGSEECLHCGEIFEGKNCINKDCGLLILKSALSCPHCAANQVPEIRSPWLCEVCSQTNSADNLKCASCDQPRGSVNPLSREGLQLSSKQDDSLCITPLIVKLASGADSSPISVRVFIVERQLIKYDLSGASRRIPSVRLIDSDIEIYIDPSHPLFEQSEVTLEEQISFEAAGYLYTYYQSLASNPEHSISSLASQILLKFFRSNLGLSDIENELSELFSSIRHKLSVAVGSEGADVYLNLSKDEQTSLVSEIVKSGHDLAELPKIRDSGQFVLFLGAKGLIEIFKIYPKLFFDGKVWNVTYSNFRELSNDGDGAIQAQIRREYGSLLEVASIYLEKGARDSHECAIAKAACRLLAAKISS
jgi:hypothetical protein